MSSDVRARVHTRAELAIRAGIDPEFIDRLCELGILTASSDDRYSEGDGRRARIVQALEGAGMSLELIAEGMRRHVFDLDFVDDPAYQVFSGMASETFQEVHARTGIPLELLSAMREATGGSAPEPTDYLRENELGALPAIELQLTNNVRPLVIERLLRTYGDSLRRMADMDADWWMTEVIAPILANGGTIADVGPKSAAFSSALAPLAEQLILTLYRGQQTQSWMRNFFAAFETGMAAAGMYRPIERPPAICFLDLSGYTRLTDERGDAAAADLAGRLARLVQRTSGEHGGKPIKWLGDGVMFHFRDPGPGVLAALEMVEGAGEAGLPPAHVGLHAGPVLFQEGDYFGRTVNVAARIADYARRGEVLVSDEVVAASGELAGVRFDLIGPVELKGLTDAVSLHVARRAG